MNPSMIAMSQAIGKVQLEEARKLDKKVSLCAQNKLPVEGTLMIPLDAMLAIYYETQGRDLIVSSVIELLLTGLADNPSTKEEREWKEMLTNVKAINQTSIISKMFKTEVKNVEVYLDKEFPDWDE